MKGDVFLDSVHFSFEDFMVWARVRPEPDMVYEIPVHTGLLTGCNRNVKIFSVF